MLYVQQYGEQHKETLLFLHGGGLSGRMWAEVVRELDDYHCIVPDLPEHGQSAGVKPLSTDFCLRQMEMLLERRGPVHVIGLSLGGALALSMLRTMPDRIHSMVLSGTAAGMSRMTAMLLNGAAAPLYNMLSAKTLAQSMMKQFHIPESFRQSLVEDAAAMNAGVTRRMHAMLSEIRLPAENSTPLLVLVGERENKLARRAAARIAATVPASKGAVVPKVGHVWSYERPALFAQVIRHWVEQKEVHPQLLQLP
ncbi:alpha/beta hydrolase [Paenibacillus albidus]|uniref:alpha/beta fold hydrolase n=1 Tax=Paenibacillus albidus TaxID=2041023 RepID=UPI001BE4F3C9|nr:alpha/beta hydrolase [Paenibacillus albidus]MBT2291781.1 alpha/beta hydrolase [Paenibacillus albidus]